LLAMSNFRDVDPQTAFLRPPSVDEWLPENQLARFVVQVIDGLDLGGMIGASRGSGSAAHHPRMLLGVLVYVYPTHWLRIGPGAFQPVVCTEVQW
jgi:hypothetical protein